jgi:hypothetical protein
MWPCAIRWFRATVLRHFHLRLWSTTASYSCCFSIDRSVSPSEIPLPSSPPKASKKSGSSKHALKFKGDDSKKKSKKAKTEVAESDETGGAGGSGGGGGGKDSLSVDETNKLRASLGMGGDPMVWVSRTSSCSSFAMLAANECAHLISAQA